MSAPVVAASGTGGLWGPALAAGVLSAVVALSTLVVNQIRARKDRQRQIFGDAFGTVMEYREFPFIVRRRSDDQGTRHVISVQLSQVQAKLNQYIGRVRVESRRVGRAYEQLVAQTRTIAGREISRSWDCEPIPATEAVHVRDIDLSALREFDEAFLQEVRDELAVLPGGLRRATRWTWRWVRRHPEAGNRRPGRRRAGLR